MNRECNSGEENGNVVPSVTYVTAYMAISEKPWNSAQRQNEKN